MSGDAVGRRFAARPEEVGEARRFVHATIDAWGLGTCGDAELVVSELVTNAIRHGSGSPLVRVLRRRDRVRIEVDDAGPGAPVLRRPGKDEPAGRGLAIVAAVAEDWGHHPLPGGKTVWAEVASGGNRAAVADT